MYITLSQTQLTTFQCNPTTARTGTVSNQSLDENCSHTLHSRHYQPIGSHLGSIEEENNLGHISVQYKLCKLSLIGQNMIKDLDMA